MSATPVVSRTTSFAVVTRNNGFAFAQLARGAMNRPAEVGRSVKEAVDFLRGRTGGKTTKDTTSTKMKVAGFRMAPLEHLLRGLRGVHCLG
jgi:hypothetical protein